MIINYSLHILKVQKSYIICNIVHYLIVQNSGILSFIDVDSFIIDDIIIYYHLIFSIIISYRHLIFYKLLSLVCIHTELDSAQS